ncbi:MAG: radical SAM protein [Bacteroidales bacterium]|nr:radical SAM protein [Bacteroidales bacterium]
MERTLDRIPVAGSDPAALQALLARRGIDPKHARRLLYWICRRGITSFGEINDIPKKVLEAINGGFVTGLSSPVASEISADGSVKYLYSTYGGLLHETVWLPDGKRQTVCISVQSGCRMGCRFCATGHNGWRGNLTAGEIVNQVISLPQSFTNIVLMGMGEPGDNIEEVIKACSILTAEWGLAAGSGRVTVSTVGVTPSVKRLIYETDCNITLSLHSPFPDERLGVIPAEGIWPFNQTLRLMQEYDNRRKRRFSVAYVMIEGKNDSDGHLEELKRLLKGTGIRVNLLPYHPAAGDNDKSSDHATMIRFKHLLVSSGIGASVRRSRGADISAGCGMLAAGFKPGRASARPGFIL